MVWLDFERAIFALHIAITIISSEDPQHQKLLILDCISSAYCFIFSPANIWRLFCEFINEITNILRGDEWRQHNSRQFSVFADLSTGK